VIFHFIYISGTSSDALKGLKECSIYVSKCIGGLGYSYESNKPFFIQYNFTLDTTWEYVG